MDDEPLVIKMQMKASINERGPSAKRGAQFADAPLPELLEALKKARETLRRMDSVVNSIKPRTDELAALRARSPEEFERLRKQQVVLQTDLRAELRRRGIS